MKKQLLIVALGLFLATFTHPQSLFAFYPCEFSHPGETGNCEGCGDLSPTVCHRDCIQGFYGYDCSAVKKVTPVCAINTTYYNNASCSCPTNTSQDFIYGGVGGFSCTPICQMNVIYSYNRNYTDKCSCPLGATTLGVSTTNSSQLDSFKCVPYNPNPSPSPVPDPTPIAYCELNKQYSFRIYPNETACTCPSNSSLVRPNWLTGTNSFTCVPINIPTPIAYCEINKPYFYNFSQTPCTCPTNSYKSIQSGYGYTGCQSFTCVSNYQPHPVPTPIIMQTCWDGSVIPSTSSCLNKPVCSYNQYWSGYSCIDYYQPYYPVAPEVVQYPSYDLQYYSQQNYVYDTYDWSTNYNWNNIDNFGYSN